jgi:branched-chain amino acid transport system substrate-binding protein
MLSKTFRCLLPCAALLSAALLASPSAGAAGQSEPPGEPLEVKVGVLVSLSGSDADFGLAAARAAELCFRQANSSNNGRLRITAVIADDGSDPQTGAEAARRLIREEGVAVICGPLSAAVAFQAAPVAQAAGVPLLTPTVTHPALTLIGDRIFRSCATDSYQALVAARYAHAELAARRGAVLYCGDNDSSRTLAEVFRREFTALGGEIAAFESFPAGRRVFADSLERVRRSRPDLLFLPDSYHDAARIASQARASGIEARFLGSDAWDSPDLLKIAPEALENALFVHQASPDCGRPACRDFAAAYTEAFGPPPGIVAALTYEAASILADAARRAVGAGPAALRAAIAAVDIETLTGRLTFDELRNAVRTCVLLAVENGRIVYRDAYRVEY